MEKGELSMREAGRRGGKATGAKYKKRLTWGAGRPTELNAELAEQIANTIVDTACSFYTAALAAGVHWRTAWRWENWGRDGKQPFAEFCALVMQARALAEIGLLERMRQQWDDGRDGRGVLALLSVRYPEDYGQRIKWEPVLAALSDAEIDDALAAADTADAGTVEGGEGAPALPETAADSGERAG